MFIMDAQWEFVPGSSQRKHNIVHLKILERNLIHIISISANIFNDFEIVFF